MREKIMLRLILDKTVETQFYNIGNMQISIQVLPMPRKMKKSEDKQDSPIHLVLLKKFIGVG